MAIYHCLAKKLLKLALLIACGLVLLSFQFILFSKAEANDSAFESGWGWGDEAENVTRSASAAARGAAIDLRVSWGKEGSKEDFTISTGKTGADRRALGVVGEAWDPDEDPGYQKALMNHLANDEDSIFFNSKYKDTAENRTVFSLQDPCVDEKGGALSRCRVRQECTADDGSEGVNMDVVVGGAGESGRAARGTQLCVSEADAAGADDEGYVPLPVFTLEDFKRLTVAPGVSTVEPAPDTLKNMNTNVYAVAQPQVFQTALGGFPVAVRAYPAQYSWDYGDGVIVGPTPLTGAPLEAGQWDIPTDTSHIYQQTGDYAVTLTTYFYGEYNVAGTGWQPVAGLNDVASAPVPISVWKATVRNVADDCNENPRSFGCPGTR